MPCACGRFAGVVALSLLERSGKVCIEAKACLPVSLRVDGFGVSESFLCSPARLARNGVAGGCVCRCARYHTRHRTVARAVELAGCSGARAKGASPERASERSERAAPEKRFPRSRRVCGGASVGETLYIYSLGVLIMMIITPPVRDDGQHPWRRRPPSSESRSRGRAHPPSPPRARGGSGGCDAPGVPSACRSRQKQASSDGRPSAPPGDDVGWATAIVPEAFAHLVVN